MNDFRFIKNESDFLNSRQDKIGASDIPIILGLSKFTTPYQLWRVKTGRDKGFQGNSATKWGHFHEPNILRSYIEKVTDYDTSIKFLIDYLKRLKKRPENYKPPTQFFPFTEFQHPNLSFLIAHPDCIDIENLINIEAKSGRSFASYRRSGMDGFDPEDKSENGIPLKYYIQVQTQLLCMGIEKTILNALIDTSDEIQFEVNENKRVQEKIIESASRFMFLVKNDKEPVPSNKNDIIDLFPIPTDKTSYLMGTDSELALKMIERKEVLSKKKKRIEEEIDDINDSLFVFIGGGKYLYSETNEKLCSQVIFQKEQIESLSEIKKNNPEVYKILENEKLIKKIDVRYIR